MQIEGLEPRLALTWAGVAPASITPPGGALAVALNSQNDATGAATIATTEVDYYSFTAGATGAYTISAATPSSNVDTVIGVFSSTGQRLAYNDDIVTSTNTDSRLTLNLVAGTRYYLGVTNYYTNSRGSYTWTIDGPAATTTVDDAYENNDSLSAAYNLGAVTAARTLTSLALADADDWFRFTTTTPGAAGSSASIAFQNSQGNLQLQLYNSTGTLLASSNGTGNSESISLANRGAGIYYVRITGAANPNYSLTITPSTTTTTPTNPAAGNFEITLSMSGLTASQQVIFQQAADRWEQVIVGDLPNATYRGQAVDDLLISASATSIDGVNGVLGQAGPDAFRSGSRLPYHGVMEFDSADMASMERSGLLFGVVLHEMGHILGIGTIWDNLLSGVGTSNPIFTGAQATAAYRALIGTNAAGVPVEAGGGAGTALGHWRESVFTSELMTGWAGPGTNLPMSTVTIGALADLGYQVSYATANPITLSSTSIAAAAASTRSATRANLTVSPTSDTATFASVFIPTEDATSFRRTPSRQAASNFPEASSASAERARTNSLTNISTNATDEIDSLSCTDPATADAAWDSLGDDWSLLPTSPLALA